MPIAGRRLDHSPGEIDDRPKVSSMSCRGREFFQRTRPWGLSDVSIVAALAVVMTGCNPQVDPGLGLATYYGDVVGALPGTSVSRATFASGPDVALTDVLFSEASDAVVSIPSGIRELDAIVTELNGTVSSAHESEDETVTVTASNDILLPFFGGTVDVDYAVDLGGGKRAAYKVGADTETVVLYNTIARQRMPRSSQMLSMLSDPLLEALATMENDGGFRLPGRLHSADRVLEVLI